MRTVLTESSSREKQILQSLIELIGYELDPRQIILFGSRGKGAWQVHADFDLAVDAEKPSLKRRFEIEEKMDSASGLYKVDLVFLPSLEKEFRDIIFETGKVVYEK